MYEKLNGYNKKFSAFITILYIVAFGNLQIVFGQIQTDSSSYLFFFSILMDFSTSPKPSSSFSYEFTYDVFLSFRGLDTRYTFTGNLYKALSDTGIRTFIDDRELEGGDEIKPSLSNAIEASRIAILVFSINYASSSFCLDELVHIIQHFTQNNRLVLPVFYGVDPSLLRHQIGSYGEAIAKHRERFQNDTVNMERLQKWKVALNQASNWSGYNFHIG